MLFWLAHNKSIKTDALDYAQVAHGFAILCATCATLVRRLAEGSYTGEARRIQSAALCVAERHGAVRSGRPLAVFTRVPEVWLFAPTCTFLSELFLQNPLLLQVVQHDLRLFLR